MYCCLDLLRSELREGLAVGNKEDVQREMQGYACNLKRSSESPMIDVVTAR